MSKTVTHIHDIVKYNERCPLRFWFVSDTNLPDAPVAAEEVVQIFPSDLVIEVLDKENTVGAGRKLRLCICEMSDKLTRRIRTVGRGAAILHNCKWWFEASPCLHHRHTKHSMRIYFLTSHTSTSKVIFLTLIGRFN